MEAFTASFQQKYNVYAMINNKWILLCEEDTCIIAIIKCPSCYCIITFFLYTQIKCKIQDTFEIDMHKCLPLILQIFFFKSYKNVLIRRSFSLLRLSLRYIKKAVCEMYFWTFCDIKSIFGYQWQQHD